MKLPAFINATTIAAAAITVVCALDASDQFQKAKTHFNTSAPNTFQVVAAAVDATTGTFLVGAALISAGLGMAHGVLSQRESALQPITP